MNTTGTPNEPDFNAERPKFELPPGYADEQSFLTEMLQQFHLDMLFDKENRDAAAEDIAFVIGNQWDQKDKAKRQSAKKPVITVNRMQAFMAQVLGSRRMNETEIEFLPDIDSSVLVAQLREDLARSIQKESNAKFAYDTALQGAVIAGMGNFKLELEYENDDVFDQAIRVKSVTDHLAVLWDRRLVEPTGKDAQRAYVIETMTHEDFKREYPWAEASDMMMDVNMSQSVWAQGWNTIDLVRVVEYWNMRSMKRTVAMMRNGSVVDITDNMHDPDVMMEVMPRPDGSPFIREVYRPFAERYVCSATCILEGPYRLPIDRIPVFRVPGWEFMLGDKKFRNGLIRFLKDPQRLHNYFRSVWAEKIMQSPRATWVASDQAVQGREAAWRSSHRSDDSLLIWNQDSGHKPERVMPIQIESALMQQSELTAQDIKDVSNIHEANLGMPSNEVSGVAIQRRQEVSDVGTIVYHDNLETAISECGRVMDQLMKITYDTPRIIHVMGKDGAPYLAIINHDGNPYSVDITEGKCRVTATTGRAYATKRREEAQNMLDLATSIPNVMSVAADLIVEAQDWPMAEKIAARIRKSLPPGLLSPDEMTPEQQQNMQQQGAIQQTNLKMQMAQGIAQYMQAQSQAQLNQARAAHFQVQAQLAPIAMQHDALKTASQLTSAEVRDHIELAKI